MEPIKFESEMISNLGVEGNRKVKVHVQIISNQAIGSCRTEKIFFIGSTIH